MSTPVGSSQWMYATASGFYPYLIDQSLRFDAVGYLTRNTGAAGNTTIYTTSVWVKRSNISSDQYIINAGPFNSGNDFEGIHFKSDNTLRAQLTVSNSQIADYVTNAVFRDTGAWYHIVWQRNGQAYKIYVNGTEQTYSTSTFGSNPAGYMTANTEQLISGRLDHLQDFDGYLAEFNFVDGTALDPTSFGETINGVWVPKAYSGSYGTNGFYLSYADSSAIGDDLSGNTNDFTASNLAASDVVPDSPTLNYSNIVPMANTSLSEGNLKLTTSRTGNWDGTIGSFGVTSGKWYHEVRFSKTEANFRCVAGWIGNEAAQTVTLHGKGGSGSPFGTLFDNYAVTSWLTTFYKDGGTNGTMTTPASGDVMNIAADFDNGKIWFGINGTYYANDGGTDGDPAGGTNESLSGIDLTASEYVPFFAIRSDSSVGGNVMIANFGQEGTFAGTETDGGYSDGNGYGSFFNAVPSGFLALNSANLPEPTISPNAAEQADDYFNTVLYTGTGATQSITVGFQPDWVFVKRRAGVQEPSVTDSVRGVNAQLRPASTAAESAQTDALTSFDANGFTLGADATNRSYNYYTDAHVAWNWKAGGTAVSNTDGSITSQVSAAPDAGFSIVSYTGTGSAGATVGHGLGVVPELLIIRRRDPAEAWPVWVGGGGFSNTQYLRLNGTNAVDTATTLFNSTTPTSSVVTLGTGDFVNTNTKNYIMYAFASVESYCKIGSYVGNGSADGTFVYTGFRPSFILAKSLASGTSWFIKDSARSPNNVVNLRLYANASNAEMTQVTFHEVDFLSNGFKLRGNGSEDNGNGNTHIYLAFAEAPFKYANAR